MSNKMELEEAKEYLPFIIRDLEASYYNQNFINALKTIKKELKNSIPKKKIEYKIKGLEERKVQLPVEHIKQAQIKILQELLEDK